MKTYLFLIALFLITIPQGFAEEDFESSYQRGYQRGATHDQTFSIPPISPIPPIPKIGEDTPDGGYDRGFLDGMKSRRN